MTSRGGGKGEMPLDGLFYRFHGILILAWWLQKTTFAHAQVLSPGTAASLACPLNLSALTPNVAQAVNNVESIEEKCTAVNAGLEIVIALYLRQTGFFLLPDGSSGACIMAYQSRLNALGMSDLDIAADCSPSAFFSERGTDICHGIQTAQDFRTIAPPGEVDALNSACSDSLETDSSCGNCNVALVHASVSLSDLRFGNNGSCKDVATVYTLGEINIAGPTDPSTLVCILYISPSSGKSSNKYVKFIAVGVGAILLVSVVGALILYWRYRHVIAAKREARRRRTRAMLSQSSVPTSSINWFSLQELKRATNNFSRDNILGTGGFGNVYKGTLPDGLVVAVKRFKNCAPAGDADFVHEVEMISSVKHRHLVAIRGCCVDSSEQMGGHQRIIVYDYMPNGSLADHLFPKPYSRNHVFLDWATRSKIAIGMARGLAYLHHDALPAIYHRDIKPSNILLDADFEARLADFGLAKFTPEGVSHLTTRAAGTYGYVAPEYALYGQLTEKSDVYSFGMVVLELITGKKALSSSDDYALVSEWAWPLAKEGKWRSVIDPQLADDMEEDDVMERFLLVALLCAHPQVFYRPSIDQALRMLESSAIDVPPVPDRPLPFTSNKDEIREAVNRESQGRTESTKTGFSSYYMARSVNSTSS